MATRGEEAEERGERSNSRRLFDETQIAHFATLPEMEWRVAILQVMLGLQRQVDENTDITADTQEMMNRDVLGKVAEMYDAFAFARDGLQLLSKIGRAVAKVGRGVARAIEFGGRMAKPLFWIAAVSAAGWTFAKTGVWQLPAWWSTLFR